jgi:hypothetical protein
MLSSISQKPTTNTRGFENTLIGTGFPFKAPQHLDAYLDMFKAIHPSIWLWYLKMMSPAFLAALMAILSVGCMIKGKNE